jgi:radical SAM protein with 4Fe4S-binding SPASM domain
LDLALSPEELRVVLAQWIDARKRYAGRMEIVWHDCRVGMLVPEREKRNYVGCGAGRLVARILPDGTITPCVFLPTSIGSVRDDSFKSLWSSAPLLRKFRERAGHVGGNCGSCQHLKTCGGCRAVAYAYSGGDALAGDPHCWVSPSIPLRFVELRNGEGLPL